MTTIVAVGSVVMTVTVTGIVVRVGTMSVVGVLRVGSSGVMTGRVAPVVTTTTVVAATGAMTTVAVAPAV
ncbi:hypothetical protein PUR30_00420, partial [Streptomyces sp. JV190]|nr:hypothetical protein [Streptomyces sp. JV190]